MGKVIDKSEIEDRIRKNNQLRLLSADLAIEKISFHLYNMGIKIEKEELWNVLRNKDRESGLMAADELPGTTEELLGLLKEHGYCATP